MCPLPSTSWRKVTVTDIDRYKVVAAVTWADEEGRGRRHGANYGYWAPGDENMFKLQDFVQERHGDAPDVDLTILLVEDVTGSDPQQVSIAANSIGYALQEADVEFSTESILSAAQRLADQGLLK